MNAALLILALAFFVGVIVFGTVWVTLTIRGPRPPHVPLRREDKAMTDEEIARYRHDDDL